jgi:hypothetical protein
VVLEESNSVDCSTKNNSNAGLLRKLNDASAHFRKPGSRAHGRHFDHEKSLGLTIAAHGV